MKEEVKAYLAAPIDLRGLNVKLAMAVLAARDIMTNDKKEMVLLQIAIRISIYPYPYPYTYTDMYTPINLPYLSILTYPPPHRLYVALHIPRVNIYQNQVFK